MSTERAFERQLMSGADRLGQSTFGAATSCRRPGVPYLGKAGTEHNVINASGRAATFVEIELKR